MYSDKAKENLSLKEKQIVEPSYECTRNFLKEIESVKPKTVALHLFSEHSGNFVCTEVANVDKLPPSLRKLYNPDHHVLNEDELQNYCRVKVDNLKLSEHTIVYIEEATRNQAHCIAWFEQRAGRITGSVIADVFHADMGKENVSLVKKICKGEASNIRAPALMWGREHEKDGIEL